MKFGIIGASGRLGSEVVKLFNEKDHQDHQIVFAYDLDGEWKNDKPEVLIDCSLPLVFDKSIDYACDFNVP